MHTADWLNTFGLGTQVIGLGLVLVELAVVREFMFGELAPWTTLRNWWRARRKPGEFEGHVAADHVPISDFATGGGAFHFSGEGSHAARIKSLEAMVAHLLNTRDDLMGALRRDIAVSTQAAIEQADRRVREIRSEIDADDQRERRRTRGSVKRQYIGAIFVALGLAAQFAAVFVAASATRPH